MISGASEEELTEAIGRADILLELQPKIDKLKQENQKLKKDFNKAVHKSTEFESKVYELETQQKEFIEWLVKMSKDLFQNEEYGSSAIYGYILSKYKEIIGCKE